MNHGRQLRKQERAAWLRQTKEQLELAFQQRKRPELEERKQQERCDDQQFLPVELGHSESGSVIGDKTARLGQDEELEVGAGLAQKR